MSLSSKKNPQFEPEGKSQSCSCINRQEMLFKRDERDKTVSHNQGLKWACFVIYLIFEHNTRTSCGCV